MTDTPAYIITTSFVPEGSGSLAEYVKAIQPLLVKYDGAVVVGGVGQKLEVLEDTWDNDLKIAVLKFPSMEAVNEFWYSDEYQKALPLRTNVVKTNFTVAVKGIPKVDIGSEAGLVMTISKVTPGVGPKLKPYMEALAPINKKYKAQVLVGGLDQGLKVLEDTWGEGWVMAITKFSSTKVAKDFWQSKEYQQALPLRTKIVPTVFTILMQSATK